MTETKLIESKNSFLSISKYDNIQLLPLCVEEVDGLLIDHPKFIRFGKECQQNRSIGFFSNKAVGYKYSNQIRPSIPIPPNLQLLLDETNTIFNSNYNGVLVNKYSNGSDYIGAHSDEESGLEDQGVISISFGVERIFRIRDKTTKAIVLDVPTLNGTFIRMGGRFQSEYTHEIPKSMKIKNVRYSFTFRTHI
jgi:alkylated DNA repair dioxygenase AlkB